MRTIEEPVNTRSRGNDMSILSTISREEKIEKIEVQKRQQAKEDEHIGYHCAQR